MLRTRLARLARLALVSAICLVGFVATPAAAATQVRVTGHVAFSENGSTSGRPAIANEVKVTLRSTTGLTLATGLTDGSGDFSFTLNSSTKQISIEFDDQLDNSTLVWFDAGDSVGTPVESLATTKILDSDRVANVVIGAGAAISGTVLGTDGLPVPGLQIIVDGRVDEDSPSIRYVAQVDEDGHYDARGLDPGLEYRVGWYAYGYALGRYGQANLFEPEEWFEVGDYGDSATVDGTIRREVRLGGSLYKAYGSLDPTSRLVRIEAWNPVAHHWETKLTLGVYDDSDDNDWRLGGLEPGRYRLTAFYDGPAGYNEIQTRPYDFDEGGYFWWTVDVMHPGRLDNLDYQFSAMNGALGNEGKVTEYSAGGSQADQLGTIYTSSLGTWIVWKGPILDAYKAAGGPLGAYGWPVSQQACDGDMCSQHFAHGTIAPVPLTALAIPVVTGSAVVGGTLTASKGTFSPAATTWKYQWLRDGVAIPQATSATYVAKAADFDHALSVSVTGARVGSMPTSSVSEATQPIGEGALKLPLPTPKISGTVMVGKTLTAQPGIWPVDATFTYQWSANSIPIPGAVDPTLTLAPELVGKYVTVAVTGKATAYVPARKTSAPTVAVAPAKFVATFAPVITGQPQVGVTLSASTTSWDPAAVLTYRWYADGTFVTGATHESFTPSGSQLGKKITVKVTAKLLGYTTTSRTSAATAAVARGVWLATPPVSVVGDNRVGSLLTVDRTGWQPNASFKYRWYANGVAIDGATKSTFTPTSSLLGKSLKVKVTTTTSGYPVWSQTVVLPTPVARGEFVSTPTPVITGTPKVGSTLKVTAGVWSPTPTLRYQWLADGVAITGATGSSYAVGASRVGAVITVKVTATRSGFTTVVKESDGTEPVAP